MPRIPPHARLQGSGFGLISTIYLFLAAAAPTVVGALAGRDRFDEAFIALAACALATVVLSLSLSSSDAM